MVKGGVEDYLAGLCALMVIVALFFKKKKKFVCIVVGAPHTQRPRSLPPVCLFSDCLSFVICTPVQVPFPVVIRCCGDGGDDVPGQVEDKESIAAFADYKAGPAPAAPGAAAPAPAPEAPKAAAAAAPAPSAAAASTGM